MPRSTNDAIELIIVPDELASLQPVRLSSIVAGVKENDKSSRTAAGVVLRRTVSSCAPISRSLRSCARGDRGAACSTSPMYLAARASLPCRLDSWIRYKTAQLAGTVSTAAACALLGQSGRVSCCARYAFAQRRRRSCELRKSCSRATVSSTRWQAFSHADLRRRTAPSCTRRRRRRRRARQHDERYGKAGRGARAHA